MWLGKDIILHIISFLSYQNIARYRILSKSIKEGINTIQFRNNFLKSRDEIKAFTLDIVLKGEVNLSFTIQGSFEDVSSSFDEIIFHHTLKILRVLYNKKEIIFHHSQKIERVSDNKKEEINFFTFMIPCPLDALSSFNREVYSYKYDIVSWFDYEEFKSNEGDFSFIKYENKNRLQFCDEVKENKEENEKEDEDEDERDKNNEYALKIFGNIPFSNFENVTWFETLNIEKKKIERTLQNQTKKFIQTTEFTEKIILWEDGDGRKFMFQDLEEGYFAMLENLITRTYIAISCIGGHPSIECPHFSFCNSDGSTPNFKITDYSPNALLEQLKIESKNYLLHPQ